VNSILSYQLNSTQPYENSDRQNQNKHYKPQLQNG
jgi:hypothetical protein